MAGEWRRTKLGDVVEINPEVLGSDWPYDHIRYVDISSVGEGFLIELPRHLSITDAPSRAKRLVRSGDTILSTVRPNRRSMYFVKESSPDLVVSTGFAVLRPRENLIEPRYLYACVFDKNFTEYLVSREKGAAYPAVLPEDIADAIINLPPLPEQRAIAAVLGALDDKIELNRRMNRTLEAIAQAVFRHWFVENEEAEGWKIGDVSYFAQVRSGERPMTTKKIADAEYKYPLFGGGGIMAYTNKSLYDSPILLTGRVGTLGGIFRISYPCWASDNTLVLIPLKPENYYYLYFHLKQIDFEMLNRGSTQPLLTQSDLQKIEAPLPPDRLLGEFTRVVSPIFAKIDANEQQSRTLAALRDALLPKLMRGEVRVTVHE
jgi:type I restriction enzyme S subunit